MADTSVGAHDYFLPFITQDGKAQRDGCEFVVNPREGEFDAVFVEQSMQPLDRDYCLICPPTRVLMSAQEPPDVQWFPDGFVRQFAAVLTQDTRLARKRRVLTRSAHKWFVEVREGDEAAIARFSKDRLLSAVVSAKNDTVGHSRRLKLMHALKEHFGERLDWCGRGVQEFGPVKLQALERHRYHLVLENGAWPHYITEKLPDAFVANAFPFYWGAPNVGDYFPDGSFLPIDVDDPTRTIQVIEKAIADDLWGRSQEALASARRLTFSKHHPLECALRHLRALPGSRPREVRIRPNTCFRFTLRDRLVNRLWRWQTGRK